MRRYAVLNVLLCASLASGAAPAADARDEAQQATQKFVEQLGVAKLRTFWEGRLQPEASKVLSEAVAKCRGAGAAPTGGFIVYMLIIDTEGSAQKVLGVRETPFHKCVAETLEQAEYPEPPQSPFYALLTESP